MKRGAGFPAAMRVGLDAALLPGPDGRTYVVCYVCRCFWTCGDATLAEDTFREHDKVKHEGARD